MQRENNRSLSISATVCCLQLFSSTDRPTVAHGEVAELLRQGPHHGGGLDGHSVLQSWSQDGALWEEKQHYENRMQRRETACKSWTLTVGGMMYDWWCNQEGLCTCRHTNYVHNFKMRLKCIDLKEFNYLGKGMYLNGRRGVCLITKAT